MHAGENGADEQRDMLIIGGEDHKTGQDEDPAKHFGALEEWSRERLPQIESIDFRWSGQVMEPDDYLGFIGRNPGDKQIYIATGDSGMGMTHGTIAGILLTDLIQGRENPWAKLYDPSRANPKAAGEFVKDQMSVVAQYRDYVTPGQVTEESEIAPRQGAVMRRGLAKVAVYK